MANITINNLTELTGAAASDFVPVWDVSAGTTRKVTLTNIFAGVMAAANTFTATQTIQPASTSDRALNLYMPNGSVGSAIVGTHNSVNRFRLAMLAASNYIEMIAHDNGVGTIGSYIHIGNNSNATQGGAGFLKLYSRTGSAYRVWVDNSGNVRIHTSDPTFANDTSGTVIGTQTSALDSKNIVGDAISTEEALRNIVSAADAVRRFTYKNGAFNDEEFSGLIVDYAPRYGMDKDADHPAGKSLNVINAIGDLILAVSALAEKVGEHGEG